MIVNAVCIAALFVMILGVIFWVHRSNTKHRRSDKELQKYIVSNGEAIDRHRKTLKAHQESLEYFNKSL